MKKIYFLGLFLMLGMLRLNAQCTPPTIDITGTAEICSGNSVVLTATTDGQNVKWFNAAIGGTQLGTGGTYTTPNLSTTTSFWAESSSAATGSGTPTSGGGKLAPTSSSGTTVVAATTPWGLSFTANQAFVLNSVDVFLTSATPGNIIIHLKDSSYAILQTVTVAAPAGGTNSNPVQFTVPLNLTIPVGTFRLLVESGPAMIRDTGTNAFPYNIGSVGTITGGTINNNPASNSGVYYFLYNWNYTPGAAPCVSQRDQFTVTVNPTPAAPASQQFNVCGSGTIADLNTAADVRWYAGSTGGSVLASTTTLASGTYYISKFLNTCESARTAVQVTVTPIPDAPSANAYAFCGQATVAQAIPQGETHRWYAAVDATTSLTGTAALSNGTYYVCKVVNGCESTRTATTVTINDIPAAPSDAAYTLCGQGTVGELIPEGENHNWYASQGATEPLSATTALNNGTYYVSVTANGCESIRTATTVTINEIPAAPVVSAYVFCGERTVAELIPEGMHHVWYATTDGDNPLPETEILGNDTYYVSNIVNGCESTRTTTNVIANAIPAAPSLTSLAICGTQTVGGASDGNNYFWYAEEEGSEALGNDTLLETGTYYVSQIAIECESPRTAVDVTVNPIPDAPIAEAGQGFENGDTLADLTVEGENLTWYSDEDGENEIPESTALADGITYYVSQTVNGCQSEVASITVNEVLGLETINFDSFTYAPNPTSGKLMLTNNSIMENINIYSLVGQMIDNKNINALQYELDLTQLAEGTYIITVQSGSAIKNIKIIKR